MFSAKEHLDVKPFGYGHSATRKYVRCALIGLVCVLGGLHQAVSG